MADEIRRTPESEKEGAEFVAGPGVVATKAQAKGAVGGGFLGAIVGGILGVLIGLIFFRGSEGLLISLLVIGFGGATCGAVIGGFMKPRRDPPSEGGT